MAKPNLTEPELRHFHDALAIGIATLARKVQRDVRDRAADVETPEHSQTLDDEDDSLRLLLGDLRLRLDERDASLAEAMEAALERMAHGKYGVCVDCGKPIERERLELEPWTPRCRESQALLEKRQELHPPTL